MLIHEFQPESWDTRRNLIVPGDHSSTITFCVDHFVAVCKDSIEKHGFCSIALSGGSTPKEIYQRLTSTPYKDLIDWKKILLFWGDERSVPPTDPDSNFHMAMDAGFGKMPIPKENIFRMHAEDNIEQQALTYEDTIKKKLKGQPFDLMMLGMGEDGHTASLFPNTKALAITDHLVVANHVPQKNTWRMTLTYPCINSARHIAIYVLGSTKKYTVEQVLLGPGEYPIQNIGTNENKALWILDDGAAEILTRNHP